MNNQDKLLWIHYICILCVPLKLNAMSLIHERVVCYFNIQSQGICISPILGVNWYCVLSFNLRESFSEWLAVTLQLTVYDEMCVSLGKIVFIFISNKTYIYFYKSPDKLFMCVSNICIKLLVFTFFPFEIFCFMNIIFWFNFMPFEKKGSI